MIQLAKHLQIVTNYQIKPCLYTAHAIGLLIKLPIYQN
ncbi:hypothetical protein AO366_1078 [Moraxella catarrhalis]|nr:hypothetical protein AO377_1863 [Moraxella catarrhalis]OAV33803.1 hypothetical protein AO366_1078 [Moraxella catarrhalis]OAV34289.1 hypothetical protein AO365_1509 [Moraxella catarrhalis]